MDLVTCYSFALWWAALDICSSPRNPHYSHLPWPVPRAGHFLKILSTLISSNTSLCASVRHIQYQIHRTPEWWRMAGTLEVQHPAQAGALGGCPGPCPGFEVLWMLLWVKKCLFLSKHCRALYLGLFFCPDLAGCICNTSSQPATLSCSFSCTRNGAEMLKHFELPSQNLFACFLSQ